jgi:hypothetical protein
MPESPRYRRDSRLPFQEIQGQAVVVVPARRELHELDEVGTFLWAELSRERSLEDLVTSLCEAFDVGTETATSDVREFLASLEEKGLVLRA